MTAPEEKKWVRSDNDQWDILSSVGYTALLVAGWRAVHALSADPLARDDYAQHFITASADPYLTGLLANPATSEDATAFPRLYGVQTRFFDEFFMSAAADGIRQAVIVAAATTVFELDQAKVLEFKERVLTDHGAKPTARRISVAADLRDDWTVPLRAAGLEPRQRTAWSVEGVLPYLTGSAQDALVERLQELSAPGSRVAIGALGSRLDQAQLSALEATHPGVNVSGEVDFSALTYHEDKTSPADWLAAHGWAVDPVRTNPELQAAYGRTPADVDRRIDSIMHSQYITATR
jgi:methyltransferase (TIGR00027 family)